MKHILYRTLLVLFAVSGFQATAKTCSFVNQQGPILCDQHIGRVPDCGEACLDLTGKLVLVVGGSKGIGKATAERFAAAGAQVIATSRHPQDYPAPVGYTLSPVCLDIRSQNSVNIFLATAIAPLAKTIDVLVLCAGIPFYGPMAATSGDDMETHFNTNVFGYQRVLFAAFNPPLSLLSNDAHVIVLASLTAEGPIETTYGMGKRALQYLVGAWNVQRMVSNALGQPINQSTFTYLEPTHVLTTFGQQEWCYPSALSRCDPNVLFPRGIDISLPGIPAAAAAEAIYRIAATPNPKAGYFVDDPSQVFIGKTIPQLLQIVHCDPIDQGEAASTAFILTNIPPAIPPCSAPSVFVPCVTGLASCAGGL